MESITLFLLISLFLALVCLAVWAGTKVYRNLRDNMLFGGFELDDSDFDSLEPAPVTVSTVTETPKLTQANGNEFKAAIVRDLSTSLWDNKDYIDENMYPQILKWFINELNERKGENKKLNVEVEALKLSLELEKMKAADKAEPKRKRKRN